VSPALTALADASTFPQAWRIVPKFGYFLGLAALIGTCFAQVAIIRPALRKHASPATTAVADRLIQRVIGVAAAAFPLLFLLQYAADTGRHADTDLLGGMSPSLLKAAITAPADPGSWYSEGALTLVQLGLALVVAVLLVPLIRRPDLTGRRVLLATPLAFAITLVALVPANKDALTFDGFLDTALDQTHIVSGGIWIGGLLALSVLTLGHQRLASASSDAWSSLWKRFSLAASICVGALSVSGLWLAWKHVGSVGQLFSTTYGELLAVKLLIVALLIGFGGYNQTVLMPRIERLRRAGHHEPALRLAVQHFGNVVRAEAALGVAVLLIVGMLSGSAREQGGSPDAVTSGQVWGWGVGFAVTVVVLFAVTARFATFLAERPLTDDALPATG
jgi:copper transport protein